AISGYPYLDEGENGVTPVCAYDGDIVTTGLVLPGVSSKSGAKPNVITGLIAIA
ncbi:hypothetical protein GZ367_004129, partial [Salmonella enterica]|nr:hypothetical protein [Salmonella enterica]